MDGSQCPILYALLGCDGSRHSSHPQLFSVTLKLVPRALQAVGTKLPSCASPVSLSSCSAFLQKLNETAAALFESSNELSVAEGVSLLNEQIIPCMHLMINNNISQEDLDAIEVMRSRWCSYLGKDMDGRKHVLVLALETFHLKRIVSTACLFTSSMGSVHLRLQEVSVHMY